MASVDWQKISGGNAYGIIAHINRHDGRENVNYSNSDIDPNRSNENYTIGWRNGSKSINVFLNARIKELDKKHPPKRIRKDRVTQIGFVVHPPEWLNQKQERAFYRFAYDTIAEMCGGYENVTEGKVHHDEVHKYYDKIKGDYVMSRPHMHMIGIPWTDEWGVNAKHFSTKGRMTILNQKLDAFCMEKWHKHYLSGDCQAPGREMQALKRESRALELEKHNQELEDLSIQQYQVSHSIQEDKAYKNRLEERVSQLEADISRLEAHRGNLQAECEELSQIASKHPKKRLERALDFMDKFEADRHGNTFKDKFLEYERNIERNDLER